MSTAIIGVGHIGSAVARNLAAGGEEVILAADHEEHAATLANELGDRAGAASVGDAIAAADSVVLAVWLDTIKELIPDHAEALNGKVVIDPSNPIGYDEKGQGVRTLPDDQSAASVVASLVPPGAHYVKAFGTLGADSLASAANRTPRRAVLFYATDDDVAAGSVEELIAAAGFDPVRAGGVDDARRLEVPGGDLHQGGGLGGRLVDVDEARAAIAVRAEA
jgi:8-hydroxy-5-deazaflavin:NADPH oxidoreductase